MGVSGFHQAQIQNAVDAADQKQRSEMRAEAEAHLLEINNIMGMKILSREEKDSSDMAIEILTRLDAREAGGGWWFRTKRRVQLVQMYFGS